MVVSNQLIAVFSQLSWCMGYIADYARKFFHSAAINDMLSTFVPLIDGASLDVGANLSYIYFCPDLFLRGSYLLNTTSRLFCPSPILKAILGCYSVCRNPSTHTSMMNECYISSRSYQRCILILGSAIRENSLKFRMRQFQRGKQDPIGPLADSNAGFEIGRLPKPQWRIGTFSPVNRFRLCSRFWI